MNRGTVRRIRRAIRGGEHGWFGPPPGAAALVLLFGDGGAWMARMLPSRSRLVELSGPAAPRLRAICDRDSTAARMRERGHEARSLEAAFRASGSGGSRRVLELLDEADRECDVRAVLVTPEFLERVPSRALGRVLGRMRAVVEASGAPRSANGATEDGSAALQLAPTILAPSGWIDVERAERALHEIRRPGARAEVFETLAPGPRSRERESGGGRNGGAGTKGLPNSDAALAPVRLLGWRVGEGASSGESGGSDSAPHGGGSGVAGPGSRIFLRIARPAFRRDALGRLAASGLAREIVVHALPGEPLGVEEGRIAGVPCERTEDLPRFLDRVFAECAGAGASAPGREAILVTDSETEPLPLLEAGVRFAITNPGAGVRGTRPGARLREIEILAPAGVPIHASTRDLIEALRSGHVIDASKPPPRLAEDDGRFDAGFAEWLAERFDPAGRVTRPRRDSRSGSERGASES